MSNFDRHAAINGGWFAAIAIGAVMTAAPIYWEFSRQTAGVVFWTGVALLSCSILAVILGLLREKGIGKPVSGPFLLMAIGVFIICGGAAWHFWPMPEGQKENTKETIVQPAVLEAQMKELAGLDEFIGKKDENDLRDTFDFPRILKYNIKFQIRELSQRLVSKEESGDIDNVFRDGQARIDMRYANIANVNNSVQVTHIPGKIGLINTTTKYVESRKMLAKYMSSTMIPNDVRTALVELDRTIEQNTTTIIEVLNEKLADNRNNILKEFDDKSYYRGGTSGYYWVKFIPLRPKVDSISHEIRKHLAIN